MKILSPEELIKSVPNPLKYDPVILSNLRPYLKTIEKEVGKI
jgi:hypothetical protein